MATVAHGDITQALKDIDRRHGEFYDALTDSFETEVDHIVLKTVATIVERLSRTLKRDGAGNIAKTPANLQALVKLDTEFKTLMRTYGYDKTVRAFVAQFPGQLPLLREALDLISATLQTPLVYRELLGAPDKAVLKAQQMITIDSMVDIVANVGAVAKRKAMLGIGGLSMEALTETLSTQLGKTRGEASTLGATSMAMFYRIATERVMDRADPHSDLKYTYDGPDDVLTRPFCHRLKQEAAHGETWSKSDIDRMNNGQIPDVMVSGGGYNCRHQFRIALPDERNQ